jgi:hypothetical protein
VPSGKGVVSVAATGKRRQSYVVRLITEKKDWFLAEFWDYASPPFVSPDGRWLVLSAEGRRGGGTAFVLQLNKGGSPELTDKPEFGVARGVENAPAWHRWSLRAGDRARGEPVSLFGFSPTSKRVLVGGGSGELRVFDVEKFELKATLMVFNARDAASPDWLISTDKAYIGSPEGEKSLATSDKERDPALVKEALWVR